MLVKTKFPNQVPLRIKPEAVTHLSSLTQFYGIPDQSLIRLAHSRTGLNVPDRWVAIALILCNYTPVPVAGQGRPRWRAREAEETPARAKLQLIPGGRIGG